MNRIQFMEELERLLSDIPAEEREEAIRYYDDYFDDAGFFEEEKVIKELVSPQKVATQIKSNLYGKVSKEDGEYTERGYRNEMFEEAYQVPANAQEKNKSNSKDTQYNYFEQEESYNNSYQVKPKTRDTSKIILFLFLAILTAPIWLGLAGGLLGVVVGLAGGLFGIIVGFGATSVTLFLSGVTVIGLGISQFPISVPGAIVLFGAGFILLAIALVFLGVTILIVTRLIPGIVRGVLSLGSKIFNGNRRVAA